MERSEAIMPTSRLSHRLAIRGFVGALAVSGTWLLVSGVVPTEPPGGTVQVADSLAITASSTALTVSPASAVAQGTPVTLKAMVTHAAAPGSVQFMDGSTNVGAPVRVNNGTASETTSMLSAGSHRLIAVFTPADPVATRPSTSPATVLTVTALPAVTGLPGNGSLPTITPQQSGLSLESPTPVALDNPVPTAKDTKDIQAPVALDNRIPTILNNRAPLALDIRIPAILDNPMSAAQDNRVSISLGNQTATPQDNRTRTSQDNRGRASQDGQGRFGCRHSKCDSGRKCGSPKTITSGAMQPGQSSMGQSSMSSTTDQTTTSSSTGS
ncbi:MAG: Ig-like domain repeat protein [Pseudonocardiales bacterium]|nr:Ig-like domain repeat protein [Pseudonocardiales bacterium]